MNHLNNLENDLSCPISGVLLEDPIVVPCCQKAFSRIELTQYLEISQYKTCPNCRKDLDVFDPLTAPKNIVLAGLVENFIAMQNAQTNTNSVKNVTKTDPKWTCYVTPVVNNKDETIPVAELKISLENAKFVPRPSLFIAVVDRSGSMAGSAWAQVETALIHIMGLTRSNPFVKTVIVAYDSNAEIINVNGSLADVTHTIKTMFTGGGTNFVAAFNKIKDVLQNYICTDEISKQNTSNNVSNATIAFLTDGESGQDRNVLINTFRDLLREYWQGPVSVHSIGFGRNCDRELLEGLWKTGTINGTFRYAEPQDDGDTLCGKLTNLFDTVSKSSTVQLELELDQLIFRENNNSNKTKIQFPINEYSRGLYTTWVIVNDYTKLGNIIIKSSTDYNTIAINLKENSENIQKSLFKKWLSTLIDDVAAETLDLSTKDKNIYGINPFNLHLELLQQRIDAIEVCIEENLDKASFQRLHILQTEINSLRQGLAVNMGKLGDLRFGSQYIVSVPKQNTITNTITNTNVPVNVLPLDNTFVIEKSVIYSRNSTSKNRNMLQRVIVGKMRDSLEDEVINTINKSSINDLEYTDVDGNNALMLAAYCGHSQIVSKIINQHPYINIEHTNINGETAVTLAIKKQGFYRTIRLLLNAGATIPANRRRALEQYAIEKGYRVTANLIASTSENITTINKSMGPETIKFIYERNTTLNAKIDVDLYMDICLNKCMVDMVEILLNEYHPQISIDVLFSLCVPNSSEHVKMFELLLNYDNNGKPLDINEKNSDGDTLLFRASEKGCIEIVNLLLERDAIVDCPNSLGNTPLWIACCNRFIDIVNILISVGANVNYANLKGNTPLVPVCQRGPEEIAEILLANGATVDQVNNNGDNVILLCCRNGQAAVLKMLLDRAKSETISHRAHIDGFSAILAATESDRVECIRTLHEYGVDLEESTANDNAILAGATSLHLAAYYGRVNAARTLLVLGANPNAIDINKSTPMHIAVIQGHATIVKLLRNYNADCMAKDSLGYTPASYCRTNEIDLVKVLTNPALDIMMLLATGQFNTNEEKIACNILLNHTGALGCLSKSKSVDIIAPDGKTPLMQAIIHSNFEVVKVLLQLGSDPYHKNLNGINSFVWAQWTGNNRIIKLLPTSPPDTIEYINRLKQASTADLQNSMILYLSTKPKDLIRMTMDTAIYARMNDFVNNTTFSDQIANIFSLNQSNNSLVKTSKAKCNKSVIEFFDKNCTKITNDQSIIKSLVWMGKIFTTNLIASGMTNLESYHILALYMYTTNTSIAKIVNDSLINNDLEITGYYIHYLHSALELLPNYNGEVYRGITYLTDRKLYMVGNDICWSVFTTASSLWKIATENTPEFSTKNKQGTIFAIKSKTGRYIGNYSQYSRDTEIIFLPNTKFKVTAWYIGDQIALGQQNIRNTTFKIKPESMDLMIKSNNSLIIEMAEI